MLRGLQYRLHISIDLNTDFSRPVIGNDLDAERKNGTPILRGGCGI